MMGDGGRNVKHTLIHTSVAYAGETDFNLWLLFRNLIRFSPFFLNSSAIVSWSPPSLQSAPPRWHINASHTSIFPPK